ncbi:hypothetical protein [Streptosporangium sandarakinum]|uniref:hypothetical protein n=1 Tax=Streptosporangium sandarakinum TaxID=1260955 RepID=UPI0037239BE2
MKATVALTSILVCALGAGWTWLLSGRTLQEADNLSSVLSGLVSTAFGIFGLVFGALALRPERSSPSSRSQPDGEPAVETDRRPGKGSVWVEGDVYGPIVTGDKNRLKNATGDKNRREN